MSLRVGRSSGARWGCVPGPPVSMSHGPDAGWRAPCLGLRHRDTEGSFWASAVQACPEPSAVAGVPSEPPSLQAAGAHCPVRFSQQPPAPAPGPGRPRGTPGPPSTRHHTHSSKQTTGPRERQLAVETRPLGSEDESQSASVSHTFRVGGLALRLMALPSGRGGAHL